MLARIYDMDNRRQKIIGTAVPLFALHAKDPRIAPGTFGAAMIFLSWLKKTEQHAWQVLPLHQTHLIGNGTGEHAPSPYRGYGIGIDPRYRGLPKDLQGGRKRSREQFLRLERGWIADYALFCALRDEYSSDDWTAWEPDIRDRRPLALGHFAKKLRDQVEDCVTEQWRLRQEFDAVKASAKRQNIRLIGDLPYYLPLQSPLVWRHRHLFDITNTGRLRRVSGIVDGPKAHFGRQVWGHPLYAWKKKDAKQMRALADFFRLRIAYAGQLYDCIRFDHAKGFYSYGSLNPDNPAEDRMRRGPGADVFDGLVAYSRRIGLTIFAEDSGDRTKDLRASLDRLAVPGIRLFRFAYNEKKDGLNLRYADVPHYPKNVFAYTSSHDTEPLMGYLTLLTAEVKRQLANHAGVAYDADNKTFAARLRQAILCSPAQHVIIPMQDWLLIKDRINIPGTEKRIGDANWRFRTPMPIEDFPLILSQQFFSSREGL